MICKYEQAKQYAKENYTGIPAHIVEEIFLSGYDCAITINDLDDEDEGEDEAYVLLKNNYVA